ncbi:T-cell surface glycoprotein CD8 beta chain, partial [Cariama cristata]
GFCTNLLLSQAPEGILAQTNNETQILCELKENAGVYWYRWSQARQIFEFLVFSNMLGKATYGTNISQDKFSVRGVSSHTSYSLHISHLHDSDNGTYYCSVSQSSQLLLGRGTQLGVGKHHPQGAKMCLRRAVMRSPGKGVMRVGACSPLIWVPLATGVLVILLSLVHTAHRLHRLRRRLWLRIHRQ